MKKIGLIRDFYIAMFCEIFSFVCIAVEEWQYVSKKNKVVLFVVSFLFFLLFGLAFHYSSPLAREIDRKECEFIIHIFRSLF